jgi:hypothetical protein
MRDYDFSSWGILWCTYPSCDVPVLLTLGYIGQADLALYQARLLFASHDIKTCWLTRSDNAIHLLSRLQLHADCMHVCNCIQHHLCGCAGSASAEHSEIPTKRCPMPKVDAVPEKYCPTSSNQPCMSRLACPRNGNCKTSYDAATWLRALSRTQIDSVSLRVNCSAALMPSLHYDGGRAVFDALRTGCSWLLPTRYTSESEDRYRA